MRYRLPDGCAGVSIAGVVLEQLADDGLVEADASAAAHLAPHGIVPVEERRSPDASAAPRKRGART